MEIVELIEYEGTIEKGKIYYSKFYAINFGQRTLYKLKKCKDNSGFWVSTGSSSWFRITFDEAVKSCIEDFKKLSIEFNEFIKNYKKV